MASSQPSPIRWNERLAESVGRGLRSRAAKRDKTSVRLRSMAEEAEGRGLWEQAASLLERALRAEQIEREFDATAIRETTLAEYVKSLDAAGGLARLDSEEGT